MRQTTLLLAAFALTATFTASPAVAQDKGMMHCFAYTVKAEATPADWDAFYKATAEMPKKIKEVKQVWYGKLRRPLTQYRLDAANNKKFAETPTATVEATRVQRQQGVCMMLESEAALKAYETHPYHKEWVAAYEKVRVAGTTTYDILTQ